MNPPIRLTEERIRHVAKLVAADLAKRNAVETKMSDDMLARKIGAALRTRAQIDEEAQSEALAAIRKRTRPLREGTNEYAAELLRLRTDFARARL